MRLEKIKQIKKDQPVSDIRRIRSYRPELFGQPFSACLQHVLRGESDWSVGERDRFAAVARDAVEFTVALAVYDDGGINRSRAVGQG